jgi:hypothetical protein
MKTKSSPATAAPVAPAAGLKRINLAGIATKAPAAKAAKTYHELPDPDGQVAALVEGILEKSEQLEAIEGALKYLQRGADRHRQAVLLRPSRRADGSRLVSRSQGR